MQQFWISGFLVALMTSSCLTSQHGTCDTYEYNLKIRTCQAKFFESFGNATNRETECPIIYHEAVTCANETITECYKNMKIKTMEMVRASELEMFGNQSHYCVYGGIPSIAAVILNLHPDAKCKEPVNAINVTNCENPFYEKFRNDPGSKELCSLSAEIRQCQIYLLSLCNKASPRLGARNRFVPNTAHLSSVHCPVVKNRLLHPKGGHDVEGLNHPTSWDVLTPVIIIAILMLLALLVGFCHYAKQEKKKNKQQNKDTKQKLSERVQQVKQNAAGTEPGIQEEEMLPLSSVMTQEKEEISTV